MAIYRQGWAPPQRGREGAQTLPALASCPPVWPEQLAPVSPAAPLRPLGFQLQGPWAATLWGRGGLRGGAEPQAPEAQRVSGELEAGEEP